MAQPTLRQRTADTLTHLRWEFVKEGDKIGMHEHPPETAHLTICVRGRVRFDFPDGQQSVELSAGEDYDFGKDQQRHEVTALEPDTVIYNVRKG